jgi:hypothetical protein
MPSEDANVYKIRIGRPLLLGREVLVAADTVKIITHEWSFISLGLLAGLVLVRLFSTGRWSWLVLTFIAVMYQFKSHSAFPFHERPINSCPTVASSGEA